MIELSFMTMRILKIMKRNLMIMIMGIMIMGIMRKGLE